MEKRREAPSDKPFAAPRADVERVLARLDAMGLNTLEDVMRGAKISRPTYFRFKRGDASVGTVRSIEEFAVREESKRRVPSAGTKSQQDGLMAEWLDLGEQLMAADPERFRSTMDGVRDMLEAARLTQRALSKMFRATPDPER